MATARKRDREDKARIVGGIAAAVGSAEAAILTDYRGLNVAEVTALRRKLRPHGAEYHVVKNTLYRLALGEERSAALGDLLTGPTAVVFSQGDIVAPAKAVVDFFRDLKRPEIKVKGGWLDGRLLTAAEVTALSKLPPRDQLVAEVVGMVSAPISEFVGTLDSIISDFVYTVAAVADKAAAQPAG